MISPKVKCRLDPYSNVDLTPIYALGATLFHTITGGIPRMNFDIRNLPDGYSKAFWGMILAMLSSDPSKRPVIKKIVGLIEKMLKADL